MGGWISLWLASQEKYKRKINSMIVIAPAVNFLRPFYAEMLKNLPKEAQETLEKGEVRNLIAELSVNLNSQPFTDLPIKGRIWDQTCQEVFR